MSIDFRFTVTNFSKNCVTENGEAMLKRHKMQDVRSKRQEQEAEGTNRY